MKWLSNALFFSLFINASACPFSNTGDEVPCDENHRHVRRRRLASLSEDDTTREKLASIIAEQKRSLQAHPECITTENYENLRTALDGIASGISNIGDRGHFLGGVVRLAAHDFMDFDQNVLLPSEEIGGPDGCIEFSHPANAGLDDLWCDDPDDCPLKALYDDVYANIMSRADFWVASATAVIENTAPSPINLPFLWGRKDRANCPNSAIRLPEPNGCNDVEDAFINRMGLSWTDAVALLGAHTLGRGDADFSGHPGTWVNSDEESTVFDKRFYRELLNRAWRPREENDDWVWGGRNRGVMMLHTDICLRFDVDDGEACCTNTDSDCRDNQLQNNQCSDASQVRPEAFAAVGEFASGRGNDNDAFFDAYRTAWKAATELGYDSLHELVDTCGDTSAPTPSPTSGDRTPRPTSGDRTPSPTSGRTRRPTPSPMSGCNDLPSFEDHRGRTRDCDWVQRKNKCRKFDQECPVTCGTC